MFLNTEANLIKLLLESSLCSVKTSFYTLLLTITITLRPVSQCINKFILLPSRILQTDHHLSSIFAACFVFSLHAVVVCSAWTWSVFSQ